MVRLVEYQQRHRGQLGPIVLIEERPARCREGHTIRYVDHRACPVCGITCQQWWCGRDCDGLLVDPDHVHGDPTEYATVVRLDGTQDRVERYR